VFQKLKKDPQKAEQYVNKVSAQGTDEKLSAKNPLADQWKLQESTYHTERGNEGRELNLAEAFSMKPGTWVSVQTPANGDLYFFELTKKGTDATSLALNKKIGEARTLLSDDAQRVLMEHLLREMKSKHAISLDFMSQGTEMTPG
jgi:hypothetical protein